MPLSDATAIHVGRGFGQRPMGIVSLSAKGRGGVGQWHCDAGPVQNFGSSVPCWLQAMRVTAWLDLKPCCITDTTVS